MPVVASNRSPGCWVLGYHEIGPVRPGMRRSLMVSPKTFAMHLASLKAMGGQCITLHELNRAFLGEQPLPARSFAITFDDGYVGIHRYAAPLLRRFGFSATVFVPSALIGQTETLGDEPPVAKMDATQLRSVMQEGITVGAHTHTHADLPTLDDASKRREIVRCRQELESLIDRPVTTFAYPFGHFDAATVQAVRDAGYQLACTTQYRRARSNERPLEVPRILISDNLQLPWFLYRLWRAPRRSDREASPA